MKSKTLSAILSLLVLTFLSDCKSKTDSADMARIPAGSFEMGSEEADSDEKPVHTVNISEFWMDKYEVTNGKYKKCVDAGSCRAPSDSKSYTRSSYYGDSMYANYPVIYVDWSQAKSYCEWQGGRLPTEAEWEYAARGGLRGMKYPNGDSISQSEANYSGSDTVKVGSYDPNGYGLYDMADNVWEWTNDWYDENYYKNSPSSNPQGPTSGAFRVVRGGSWARHTSYLSVSPRFRYPTTHRYDSLGFRCAR